MRMLPMLLLLVFGCEDDRPPPPRGVDRVGGGGVEAPMYGQGEGRVAVAPEPSFLGPTQVRETVEGEPSEESPVVRDLSAELRTAFGQPSGCGSLGERNGELRIGLSVMVTETGVVTRGRVSGPVPAETLACLNRRLEHVRLRGPIEGAPRSVSAELVLVGEGASEAHVELNPTGFELGEGAEPISGSGEVQGISNSGEVEAISDSGEVEAITGSGQAQPISGSDGVQPISGSGSVRAIGR